MKPTMFKSIFFSLLIASTMLFVEGDKGGSGERILIVGGDQVNPGDYPYFGKQFRSGSLYSFIPNR